VNLLIVRNRAAFQTAAKTAAPAFPPDEFENVRRWEAVVGLESQDAKKLRTIKTEGDIIADYLDVEIKGYLSTFKGTTESDRDGDTVEEGAFAETIAEFSKNPVMLRDHVNMTAYLAGKFTTVREDKRGLYIEGMLSNAPDTRDTRFKVAEGILKAMSMGGIFYYKEDRRTIFKVKLWEGSLVPIPANQDAIISVRSLNDTEKKFMKSAGRFPTYTDFLVAQQLQNRPGVAA
jgi:HK97 family phage prohead protease